MQFKLGLLSTNVSCFGYNDGEIFAAVGGGTGPYSFLWDDGSTEISYDSLTVGTYTLTLTDANGCSVSDSITISGPTSITAIAAVTNVSCNGGNDGAIDITASGGSGSYTYLWSNTSTDEDLSGLTAGPYTVTITDVNSCTTQLAYTVSEPSALQLSSVVTNTLCNGDSNGAIDLTVNGGTSPYAYLWSNTETTQDITGLVADDYIVVVTDSNSCTVTDTFTVAQPDSFTVTSVITDVTCAGDANGAIDVTITGGTGLYSYSWSNSETIEDISGLIAGTYTLNYSDANNCSSSAEFIVGSPASLVVTALVVNPTCNGGSNGFIDLSVSGGTSPYTYLWNDNSTDSNLGNIGAGTYYAVISDSLGCTDSTGFILTDPASLSILANITPVVCNGDSTGAINITVNGGTQFTAPTDIFISEYIEGSGNIKAIEIYNPTGLAIDLSNYSFYLANNGSTSPSNSFSTNSILGSGNTYVIANSNADSAILAVADTTSSLTFFNGNDVVWIENNTTSNIVDMFGNRGCNPGSAWTSGGNSTLNTTLIRQPFVQSGITVDPFNTPCDFPSLAYEWYALPTNNSSNLGIHTINPVQSYIYEWSNGSTDEDVNSLGAGTYMVTATDANGCMTSASFTVNEPTALLLTCSSTDVLCNGAADGAASVSVSGGTGTYSYAWSNGASISSITALSPATYTVLVTDSLGCLDSCSVTLSEPAAITLVCSSTNATCNGVADGTASVTASGGTGTLTYSWSTGETTSSIAALSPATYTVVVTDSLGCLDSCSVTIIEPSAISLSSIATSTTCNGGLDGSINVTISGGTSPYAFSWSNTATTEDLASVAAGIYTLNVLDSNNCSASITDTIEDALPLLIDSISIDCSAGTGSATVTIHATNPAANALEYSIDGGATYVTSATFTGLADGLYNIAVRDIVLGCEDSLMNVLVNCAMVDPCFNDTIAPVINCPAAIVANCVAPSNYPDINAFVAAGGTVNEICGVDSVAFTFSDSIAGTCPQTIYRTYNIADLAGNIGSCVQTITVQDTIAPVITTQAMDMIVQCDGSGNITELNAWLASNGGAIATDNCGTVIWSDSTFNDKMTCAAPILGTKATFYAKDLCGNETITFARFGIIDTIAPILTIPANVTINCNEDTSTANTGMASATDVCHSFVYIESTDSVVTGACANEFIIYRKWTAYDGAFFCLTTSETQIITVQDTSAPVITLPADMALNCGDDTSTANTGMASVSDNCMNGALVTYSDASVTGTCPIIEVITRTWTATDSCNNTSSATQTITIKDTLPPTAVCMVLDITLDASGSATITPADIDGGSFNGCGGSVALALSKSTFDCSNVGNNTVTLYVTDACGNIDSCGANVVVKDITKPLANCQPITVYVDAACSATISAADINNASSDACGIDTMYLDKTMFGSADIGTGDTITVDAMFAGTSFEEPFAGAQYADTGDAAVSHPLVNNPGQSYVNYTTVGAELGFSSFYYATGGPGLTDGDFVGGTTFTGAVGSFTDGVQGFQMSDTDGEMETSIDVVNIAGLDSAKVSIDLFVASTTWETSPADVIRIYVVFEDLSELDLINTTGQDIDLLNIEGSWMTLTGDLTGHTTAELRVSFICNAASEAIYVDNVRFTSQVETTTNVVTLTVVDNNGNASSCTALVTVLDTISPVAPMAPADTMVLCAGDIPAPVSLTATDNCDGPITVLPTAQIFPMISAACNNQFVMVRTWTFADSSGNTSSVSQTITVNDTVAPTLSGIPNDTILNAAGTVTFSLPTATDNCPGAALVTCVRSDSLDLTDPYTTGVTTITCTAVDSCGNSRSESFTVTVNAGVALTLVCAQDSVDCNGASTGSATVTVSGGVAPYSYSWSPNGETTASITGVPAGIYSVLVTDNVGGSGTCTVEVLQPNPLLAFASVVDSITCFGANDGKIAATSFGGVSPITYTWVLNGTDTVAVGDTVSNMASGNYLVNIQDANGCTTITGVFLPEPPQININATQVNVVCYGDATGSINISPSGGTLPYTYLWSNNSTDEDQGNLTAGPYTVTVTDNKGCTASMQINISENPQVVVGTTQSNVLCHGTSDGSATVSPSGGVGPYTYAWNTTPTQTGQTAFNLSAGNYEVTITDAVGCDTIIPFLITEPALLDATASVTNVTCNGATDGTATITNIIGGTPPYYVIWNPFSNPDTTNTLTGLAPGTYTAQVSDANWCVTNVVITITQPQNLFCQFNINNITCAGGTNGKLTAILSGGTAPYSYVWSNGETSAVNAGLTAGTYTVTTTDANGCTTSCSATIIEPQPLNYSVFVQNVKCAGGNDGKIIVNVNGGGTPPYTYTWNTVPTQTTSVASNLSAGQYSLIISDAAGCITTITETVSENLALVVTPTITDATCNGSANGSINLAVTGGATPYAILWSNGNTTLSNTGLVAGTYSVTITDSVGCVFTSSYTISEPGPLVLSAVITDASCNGSATGSITVTPAGGNGGPYTYIWSDGQSTATAQGLAAGTYNVTVTGSGSCVAMASYVITQSALIGMTANVNNVSCAGGSNGNATAMPTGGTPPYSYLWSNGQQTQTANGLIAGAYTVQITDAKGCVKIGNVTITEPDSLTCTSTIANIPCNGQTTGSISVNVSGGTAPYTYVWNTTPAQTTATASNLTAGNYTVTITDSKGCVLIKSFTLAQPGNIVLTTSKHNVSCKGGMDGTATVAVNGGTAPYTYLWSTNAAHTTSYATGLTAGTYTVTVSDAGGCTAITSVIIRQPAAMVAFYIPTNPSCSGASDGNINLLVAGGTAPYTFLWSNGATDEDLFNVSAGVYYVAINDKNGCAMLAIVYITTPNPLNVSASVMDVSCSGGNDGGATIFTTGGTAPYSYAWSNGQTGPALTNVVAGSYSVTVTDASGCSAMSSVTVNESNPMSCTIAILTNLACYGDTNGKLQVNVTGGTAPYSYTWSTNPIQNAAIVTNVGAGMYSVIVSDANGCTSICSVNLTEPPALTCTDSSTPITCNNANDGTATVNVSGGTLPYTYAWSTNPVQTTATATGLGGGSYTVIITDGNGCNITKQITLVNPAPLQVNIAVSDVTCNGDTNGTVTTTVTGGNPPYFYMWSDGQTTSTAINLGAGTYSLTVMDANFNLCSVTITGIVIAEPAALTANPIVVTDVSCLGFNDGSVSVNNIAGGTPPYVIAWNTTPAQFTSTAVSLAPGTYAVTITDQNGCTYIDSASVNGPSTPLVASIDSVMHEACIGATGGYASVAASGGTPFTTVTGSLSGANEVPPNGSSCDWNCKWIN